MTLLWGSHIDLDLVNGPVSCWLLLDARCCFGPLGRTVVAVELLLAVVPRDPRQAGVEEIKPLHCSCAYSLSGLGCTVLLVGTLPCKHLSLGVIALSCERFAVLQFYLLHFNVHVPVCLCGTLVGFTGCLPFVHTHAHPRLSGGSSTWLYLGPEEFPSLLLKLGGSRCGSCLDEASLGTIRKPL